jgi:ectoine hydroxylase-related dioxygenase (phytanoyl-CoA dioxygenase family)
MNIKDKFINDGYLIIENLIDKNFNNYLTDELSKIINNKEKISVLNEIYFDKESESSNKVFMIGDLLSASDKFLSLVYYEPLLNLLEIIFNNNEFEFEFLQAIIKHENIGREVKWHRDFNNKAIKYLNSDVIRIIICLDELNNNGEIQILEDSHKISDDVARHKNVKARDLVNLNQSKIKSLKCNKGSVILFNTKLIHCSLENKSNKIRRNLIMEWCNNNNAVISGMRWFYQGLKPKSSDINKIKQNKIIKEITIHNRPVYDNLRLKP